MITSTDIVQVLAMLATTRPAFCSEADFQLAFAWELKKHLSSQSYDIFLERRFNIGQQDCYVDICLESGDELYLIELKYKTIEEQVAILTSSGATCTLKDQAANDLGRYGYLKDIWRIENVLATICNKKVKGGFAIILTNDHKYFVEPKKTLTTIDHTFRIHERTTSLNPFVNPIDWSSKVTSKWRSVYPSFAIKYIPSFCWRTYSKPSCREFKYLLAAI